MVLGILRFGNSPSQHHGISKNMGGELQNNEERPGVPGGKRDSGYIYPMNSFLLPEGQNSRKPVSDT